MMRIDFLRASSALYPVGLACLVLASPAAAQTASGATVAATPQANSQTAKEPDETIIVTGSRIRRPSVDNPQPTVTLDATTITNRGYADLARALNELPGFGLPDSSLIGGQGNGFGVGQSFVNLYSLGSQRTLTLVNGRRFVGANPATVFSSAGAGTQVDLNTIPTKLIERTEIVSIGGAPIYGADAIAGTVNIVLRRDFSGFDFDAQSGVSERGDLFNARIRALAGTNFAGGRGNVTLNVEYNRDDGLLGNQRDIVNRQLGFVAPFDFDPPPNQILVENIRTFLGTAGGNPYFIDRGTIGSTRSVVNSAGQFVRFAPDGTLVPFNLGTVTTSPTTFLGGDALNFADITNLRVDNDRVNVTLLARYEINDAVEVFGEGWYSKNQATNLAGQPVYNTAFFRSAPPGEFDVNGNFIFRLNNPFLTQQARDIIRQNLISNGLPSGDDALFFVGRANTDLVSGVAQLDQDLYRIVGGFRGDFNILGRKFSWEASGNYGRTISRSFQPSLVEPNLRRALNVGRDANGNIVCLPFNPDPNDPTQPPFVRTDPNTPPFNQQYNGTISQTCAPLNLFGSGAPSQAARDYVTTNARTDAITEQRDFLVTLTGSLARLPGGDLGISAGYENRREYSRFSPDAYYTTPFGRTIPILPVEGSYTTNEVFGEFRAPLIGRDQDIPLLYSVEVNAAGRYVNNSRAGSAFTWTAGGRWALVSDFAVRGNFTRAIRAPAVTELFAADQPAFDGGFDPCDEQNLTSGPNPTARQANCAAAGLPTNFTSTINSVTVPITVIGNQNLSNETANSWTAGGVFTPRFLRGLSLSGDYVNIDLRNTVVAASAADVLSGCYDATNFPNNFFCGLVTRDQSADNFGQVLSLREPFINQGGLRYQGVQFELAYNTSLPKNLGKIQIQGNYLHTIEQSRVISAESGTINTRGNIANSVDRANINVTYEKNAFTWYNQVQYTGPARFDVQDAPDARDVTGVGSFTVWNMAFIVQVNKQLNVRFNIDNVLDAGIPFPATAGGGAINTYYQGLVGRAFLAGVNIRI